jgi:hypothetical protein
MKQIEEMKRNMEDKDRIISMLIKKVEEKETS